ncbi:winged helix-turn-helix transcriptional regulator [Granulicella paludicola]|uniref:winged helix-turn-helix transcriptional regulator n=1 Tax=Granulicella paludicola TaxID=474951 RepID=UPI0021E0378B|nr:helix-turn-helix domain-containing protein [Granulicella paludicola]
MASKKASAKQTASTKPSKPVHEPYPASSPEVEVLVQEVISRVADTWTMLVLEALVEHGRLRFTELGRHIPGISQKMLTKTVRQMESDGLVERTVYPVIPPRVEYEITNLGYTLSEAFCGVWIWAEKNHKKVEAARAAFKSRVV